MLSQSLEPILSKLLVDSDKKQPLINDLTVRLLNWDNQSEKSWVDRISSETTLPPLPQKPAVRWKNRQEKWTDRPADVDVNDPVSFIQQHYSEWINDSLSYQHRLTTTHLRKLDTGLWRAFTNWAEKHKLPDDFSLPSRSDLLAEEVRKFDAGERPDDRKEYFRLNKAAQRQNSRN